MTPDDVRQHLAESREELLSAVAAVPPELWNRRPQAGGWSVAEVLEHLHRVELGVVRWVRGALADGAAGPRASGPLPIQRERIPGLASGEGRFESPDRSAPRGGITAQESLAGLQDSRRATLEFWAELVKHDASDITLPHFVFGPLNLYEWIDFIGGHEQRHALQIRRLAGILG